MARKKTAKKAATKAAKKTRASKKPPATRSAPGPGGESALTGQGPSWWKPGMPVDPGFRREVHEDDRPTRLSPPLIPVGIYPRTQQAEPETAAVEAGLELFGNELQELKSEHLPDDMLPLDDELTTDVDDLLNGDYEAVDSLLEGSMEDLLPEVVAEVAPEDALDDDPDATEYSPPDLEDLLEVPQDVLDIVEKEMPVDDDSAIADPADFVGIVGIDEEPTTEPPTVEEPPAPPVAEEPPAEESPAEPVEESPPTPVEESPPTPVEESPPAPVEEAPPAPGRDRPAESEPTPSPAGHSLIVTVLTRLNYPLRALPPSGRVIVDWVAWSLIFWVPVVWAIAIVVVGR